MSFKSKEGLVLNRYCVVGAFSHIILIIPWNAPNELILLIRSYLSSEHLLQKYRSQVKKFFQDLEISTVCCLINRGKQFAPYESYQDFMGFDFCSRSWRTILCSSNNIVITKVVLKFAVWKNCGCTLTGKSWGNGFLQFDPF